MTRKSVRIFFLQKKIQKSFTKRRKIENRKTKIEKSQVPSFSMHFAWKKLCASSSSSIFLIHLSSSRRICFLRLRITRLPSEWKIFIPSRIFARLRIVLMLFPSSISPQRLTVNLSTRLLHKSDPSHFRRVPHTTRQRFIKYAHKACRQSLKALAV